MAQTSHIRCDVNWHLPVNGKVDKVDKDASQEKSPEGPPIDGPAFGNDDCLLAFLKAILALHWQFLSHWGNALLGRSLLGRPAPLPSVVGRRVREPDPEQNGVLEELEAQRDHGQQHPDVLGGHGVRLEGFPKLSK